MSYDRIKHRGAWERIIAKAWLDEDFKKKLVKDPKKVLNENGMEIPKDMKIKLHENNEKHIYLTIPEKPPEGRLSKEDLEKIAGGSISQSSVAGDAKGELFPLTFYALLGSVPLFF